MKNPRWARALLAIFALSPAVALAQGPQGSEFQANTYTVNVQRNPRVAPICSDGEFVVVWESVGSADTDNSNYSIQGRRFASDGSAIGSQFQVNTYTTYSQRYAAVAATGTADEFVVVWQSNGSSDTDTSGYSIRGRRFASDGTGIGADFEVNTYTPSYQKRPAVAATGTAGDFVVVWYSDGSSGTDSSYRSIQARRFASDGTGIGSDFQVNTYTTNEQRFPSVAARGTSGDFVVVWTSVGSAGTDSSGTSIQGRLFASDGTGIGSDFQVNTYTTSFQGNPSVATKGTAGDFVVVWQSNGSFGTDGSGYSIQGQRFASDGTAIGSQFQVNTYTNSYQEFPSVAATGAAGDFVVAWRSYGSAGTDTSSFSIQARRFASNGTGIGSDLQINTYTTFVQIEPSVAALGGGGFVTTWRSNQDGSGAGIFGKVFHTPVTAPTLSTDRWSVGSTQRIRWEQTLGSAATFSVDLSRNGGSTFNTIATGVPASTATAGNLNYLVPDDGGPYTEGAQVRVRAGGGIVEEASVPFSIEATPGVVVKQPYQSSLPPSSPFTIVWTHNVAYRSRMKIELSTNGGASWSLVTSLTYNQWINRGTYAWATPASGACSPTCQIRVSWLDGSASGVSNPFVVP